MRVVTAVQLDGLRAASRAFALAVKDRLGEVVHVRETLHMQKTPRFAGRAGVHGGTEEINQNEEGSGRRLSLLRNRATG
jgi:hypothetical protein